MFDTIHTSNDKSLNNIQINSIYNEEGQDFKSILNNTIKNLITSGKNIIIYYHPTSR